jgi:CNT family concentrative nucleoside transporter
MFEVILHLARGGLGIAGLLMLAWLFSENRRQISKRLIAGGLILQLVFAVILLKIPLTQQLFLWLNQGVLSIQEAANVGSQFVFGYLASTDTPFEIVYPQHHFIFAFQVLPLLPVIGALSALLFHWGILPRLIMAVAWLIERVLGIGGALGLAAAANVFIGMTEAPLLIRPYLEQLSRAALFALMTVGMATIAGTVMVLYASLLAPVIPDVMGHIITASLMSAPAALVIAGIMVPHRPQHHSELIPVLKPDTQTSMEAITRGALDTIPLLLNIVVLLIVMLALVTLGNQLLAWLFPEIAAAPITLQRICGWLFAPLVWLIGIPWSEAQVAGALMGTKTMLNELIAYIDLAQLPAEALTPRSQLIMMYALCGFANLGSLGIMLGGLTALAPNHRRTLILLGPRSIIAGTLATLMTGAVVGMLI